MYLKMMSKEDLIDGDGRKHHRFIEVTEYEFFNDADGNHRLTYTTQDGIDHNEEAALWGNVYVMNSDGKTINSLYVP